MEFRTGFGNPQVQRPVTFAGQQAISLNHGDGVVVFDGNLEVVEIVFFKERSFPHRRFHQGFGGGSPMLFIESFIQGTRIHPDAD